MLPIEELRGAIRVLSRVEKGGPLDVAKDELPLFGIGRLDPGAAWDPHSRLPYEVSDDHISYAFDEERIWRMVRLAATLTRDRDSYPYRLQDILDDIAYRTAKYDFYQYEKFKVLRHFVTGFPDRALKRLILGLSDTEQLGREHTFASFCSHAIATYANQFALAGLIKILVGQPDFKARLVLVRLFKLYPDEALAKFPVKDTSLLKQPDYAADILLKIASEVPALAEKIAEIAAGLISDHGHSVSPYSPFFSRWSETPFRDSVAKAMLHEWRTGKGPVISLVALVNAGLLSSNDLFDLLLKTLRHGERSPRSLVSALSDRIGAFTDDQEKIASFDRIIAAMFEGFPVLTDEHINATESLVYASLEAGFVSPSLQGLIKRVSEDLPKAAYYLRFPILNDRFEELPDSTQRQLCDLIVPRADEEVALAVLVACLERIPKAFRTKYIAQTFISRFGSDDLFELAKARIEHNQMMKSKPREDTIALIEILKELDPGTFERYGDVLRPALQGS
jgi:hypothetical protein